MQANQPIPLNREFIPVKAATHWHQCQAHIQVTLADLDKWL